MIRNWLGSLEDAEADSRFVLLCALAGREVVLDADEVRGALRRAELLLAAGGNPRRGLELDGRAVTAVARDLDTPEARRQLDAGLAALQGDAADLPAASEIVEALRADLNLAWQCYAAALLADDLDD